MLHEEGRMGILSWIVLGLIAGFIGGKIVNRQGQGFWLDIALGIVGAIVGGYLFSFFWERRRYGPEPLQYACRDCRFGRGASALQSGNRSPRGLI
jgi:uncharacterized membrane protein YeaQ/YmgE (transglycosylase-associated protein family)